MEKVYPFSWSAPQFDKEVKCILITSVPLMLSSSLYSINSLVDKTIAVSIENGAASVLQYARILTLDLFPTIIVTAFSGLMVHEFSEMSVSLDISDQNTKVCSFLEMMFGFLGIVTIVSLVFSNDLISLAFQRGEFNETSVNMTNIAFVGYAVGIPFFPLREVTARVYYGYNDTKIPFISSAIGVGINIVFSIIFSKIAGLIGIAFATTLSIVVSAFMNIILLKKHKGISFNGFCNEIAKLIIPFFLALMFCLLSKKIPLRILKISIACFGSVTIYFTSLKLLNARALGMYKKLIRR